MSNKTVQAIVTGRVQGVSFRYYTRQQAIQLELSGWVRNRTDGGVEAVISGDSRQVDRLLEWLWGGSPSARVENVWTSSFDGPQPTGSFEIRY